MRPTLRCAIVSALALAVACAGPPPSPVGEWRAVLASPGGPLPFGLRITGVEGGELAAVAVNGPEEVPFSSVDGDGDRIVLHFAWYDARIEARLAGDSMRGELVLGTFLTPTGDYRFLAGSYGEGLLRLSTFDGAHAFLFHARATPEGTLAGDFRSRDSYHATWTARPAAADTSILPVAWQQVGLTNQEGRLDFTFPDLEGEPVSLTDPRFAGKAVLVNIFGSWCPNCNDEAPLLAAWHRRYGPRGLEVVGLAYEFTGDAERDRRLVRRYAERHGIEYPLLLAGVSDKAEASATLPDLTAILSYPTTVFIARDGRVAKIHSGFSGPGTGLHYERLVAELEAEIERLLAP